MKKFILTGIVATMVMGLASMVTAAGVVDDTWVVQLKGWNSTGQTQSTFTAGTKTTASDSYVYADGDRTFASPTSGYGELGAIETGDTTGRCSTDYKASLTKDNNSEATAKVWNLYGAINGGAAGTFKITGWVASGANTINGDTIVELWKVGDKDPLYTFKSGDAGTASAPLFTSQAFDIAANQALNFQLRAYTPAVPEPGSLVAMLSGLVGLVGFGVRRRK